MGKATFAARLRKLIESSGLTISELAERANLSRQAIHSLLSTGQDPAWSTVQRLADALGVKVESFRG